MIGIGSRRPRFAALILTTVAFVPMNVDAQTIATVGSGWLERAAEREVHRLQVSTPSTNVALLVTQQRGPSTGSWIGRHPALFGALVGFGAGFLIGYLPGDDAVFDDFTAGFNGWVMGGIGAGTGATVGALVGAARK